ncbi:protein phosphatase 1 regulatory subunit 21-like [Anneissia japonica]|uniref:protein phosphatase 1 regulatory subunit 21-like n=1 Tax=Anneissia japonica TaxID=1529436 RepID=UPI001425567C|nr:protein phosphatase 1 regulatory subunit 21-like [Anneissia japonica]
MTDIQTKYQKLAQEFAKLRAQNQVLKKAVIEEQGKHTQFKDAIKERDQKVRKFEQEIDSLTFRNQQLTKRVNILQEDLELAETKAKKGKNKVAAEPTAHPRLEQNVIGEELRSKIQENERLHIQFNQSSAEHEQKLIALQDRLVVLETQNSQHQKVLENTQKQNKEMIEKLQEDKARLEVKIRNMEKESGDAVMTAERCQQELQKLEEDLGGKLDVARKLITAKLPFNDTEIRKFNALNVPTHDRKQQQRTKELVGKAKVLVSELCSALSNFHTYTEQRSKIFPIDASTGSLSNVNAKFCSFLHENASYLRSIETSFNNFYEGITEDALTTLETATGLQDFSGKFSKYVAYLNKLLPYQLLSLEEECALSSCSQTLESRNMELHSSLKKLTSAFTKLDSYVQLLAMTSNKSGDLPQANHREFFNKLISSVTYLSSIVKDVSKSYNFKVSLEHQLPTATQKLKTTDECVVSSLISLVTCTGKLSNFMKSNVDMFSTPGGYKTRGHSFIQDENHQGRVTSPTVSSLRQKSVNYMAMLNKPSPDSVPYILALNNRRVLVSSTESKEGLAQQLATNADKVSRLEQEKEHWLLEAQLLQIKYDKEAMKVNRLQSELQKHLSGNQVAVVPQQVVTDSHSADSKGATTVTDPVLGTLSKHPMDFGESEETSRENLIKKHYTSKVSVMTNQRQMIDSKSVSFQSEAAT